MRFWRPFCAKQAESNLSIFAAYERVFRKFSSFLTRRSNLFPNLSTEMTIRKMVQQLRHCTEILQRTGFFIVVLTILQLALLLFMISFDMSVHAVLPVFIFIAIVTFAAYRDYIQAIGNALVKT